MQKLEGSKRRAREMENGTQAPMVNNDEGREGDSAEESRAAGIAIRKRQKVDPFESGGKKKKKKVVEFARTAETARAMDDVEMKEAPQSGLMATGDAMTKSGPKRKKKKKHRLKSQSVQGDDAPGAPVSETRPDADTTQLAESSTQSSLLEEWDGILQDQLGSRSGTPDSSCPGAYFPLAPFSGLRVFFSANRRNFNHFSSIAWCWRSATHIVSESTAEFSVNFNSNPDLDPPSCSDIFSFSPQSHRCIANSSRKNRTIFTQKTEAQKEEKVIDNRSSA
jgi:hypothetical protein